MHSRLAPSGVYYGNSGYSGLITQVVYISKSLTIRGGYTTAFSEPPNPEANQTTLDAQGQGRALFISGDISVTIEGLRVTNGDATGLGGYLEPWIENPGDAGGGIYVAVATTTLRHNDVFSNTAGGELYLGWGDAMLVSENTFVTNTADYGGGMYLDFSDANLTDNMITANTTIGGDYGPTGGGGVYLFVSHPEMIPDALTREV